MTESNATNGHWYSHPYETECLFENQIGDENCTWKIVMESADLRVVRGSDLLRSGFRVNFTYENENEVILKNADTMRRAFDSLPLKSFVCE